MMLVECRFIGNSNRDLIYIILRQKKPVLRYLFGFTCDYKRVGDRDRKIGSRLTYLYHLKDYTASVCEKYLNHL